MPFWGNRQRKSAKKPKVAISDEVAKKCEQCRKEFKFFNEAFPPASYKESSRSTKISILRSWKEWAAAEGTDVCHKSFKLDRTFLKGFGMWVAVEGHPKQTCIDYLGAVKNYCTEFNALVDEVLLSESIKNMCRHVKLAAAKHEFARAPLILQSELNLLQPEDRAIAEFLLTNGLRASSTDKVKCLSLIHI